ncbi:hypothetical protein [Pseudomonas thivervalensis]
MNELSASIALALAKELNFVSKLQLEELFSAWLITDTKLVDAYVLID